MASLQLPPNVRGWLMLEIGYEHETHALELTNKLIAILVYCAEVSCRNITKVGWKGSRKRTKMKTDEHEKLRRNSLIIRECNPAVCDGKDLWKKFVLSLQ